jgi:hypothetical protein
MLPRNLSDSRTPESITWDDLTSGLPTILALAQLCGHSLASPGEAPIDAEGLSLSREALAIAVTACQTGAISIRGDKNAFEPGERFLAICVELSEGNRIEFRCVDNPEQTIRFVDGFRQLCRHGLAMHQLMNEFSLTRAGFALARSVDRGSVEDLVALGRRGPH